MTWERKRQAGLGGQRAARLLDTDTSMPKDIAAALRKARRMSTGNAIDWADGALASIGRNISDHRHDPRTGDHLRAAQSDAAALYACLTAAIDALPPAPPLDRLPSADLGVASIRQG